MLARITALTITLILSGCALFEPEPPPPPPPAPPPPPKKVEAPRMESQPLKHLAGRDIPALVKSIQVKPLTVKTRCTFRDEVTGTRGKLDLQIKEDDVKRFTAEVNIPKHGVCRFDMKDFVQANKAQHPVTLTSNGNTCAVRMWEQGPRTTIAFSDCAASCSGEAFDYLWPILVDTKSGNCN